MTKDILNGRGEKAGTLELSEAVFGLPWHDDLVYRAVTFEAANRRTGTAFFRNRALMEMTTKKMYRQKGTGNARHGSASANLFVGGGQAFGGQRHNYKRRLPAAMKRKAVLTLLSAKAREDGLVVLDSFGVKEGRTKEAVAVLKAVAPQAKRVLVLLRREDDLLKRAVRNIEGLAAVEYDRVCATDLYTADRVVVEAETLKRLEERLAPR